MARHTISFSTSGNITSGRARWVKPIEAAWPSPEAPTFRSIGIDPLMADLIEHGASAASGAITAALLVFGPGEQARTIDRAVEALTSANVPAVCLVPDPTPWRPFQRHGVVFESVDADPAMLATML